MTLSRTVSQLHLWSLLSTATLLFLLGETLGDDWDERVGGGAYPAVEYVAEKTSKTYNIPLELNEDPFFLVEWSTEASLQRRKSRFMLPPGILLVASIATAALLFVWNTSADLPFGLKKKQGSKEAGAQLSVESEDSDALLESEYGTVVDSSSVLQSILRELSVNFGSATEETLERKKIAVELLNDFNISESISPGMFEIIGYLLEATDKLAAPAKGINHALEVLQLPLSDSQAIFRLNSTLEELNTGMQEPLYDSFLNVYMEAARLYLGVGEGAQSDPTHLQPDVQPAALGRGIGMLGPSGIGESSGKGQRVLTKLSEWLEALFAQQRLLMEAAPVVSKAVADVRAAYDLP
ncbi:uncharacterized protein EMH_0032140 [Eimeria mitis]|uniref:Transmembrane protein n=1 Tax=Eimeria mitis TaxID=44415 RepID=U6JPT7_9EIME|nr:uncharacterized protein EMH_0032140 [Eimeria mitis]CDJ27479.1 hypothetical protein, conserved [Eimeria mitis]